jgi:hypothetical protein
MIPQTTSTFQLRDGVAVHRRDPGEGVEIVVDQRLAGDRDHPAIGLDLVALLALAQRAALELAALAHFQQLRRLAELHPVHRLEVGGQHLATEQHEGAWIGIIGLPKGLVGHRRQDLGEVRSRVQGPRGYLIARQAARIHARIPEAFPGQFHERHAAILAGGIFQREQRRAVAVQQRIRHGVAAGDLIIAAAQRDRHLAEGAGFFGLGGNLIEDQTAGLINVGSAFHQILGKAALEVQATGQIVDRGDAIALAFPGAGCDSFGIGCSSGVGFLGLGLGPGFNCGTLRIGCSRFRFGHCGVLDFNRLGWLLCLGFGVARRVIGFVRHRDGSCGWGWDVPAMKDAVVKRGLGAKACGGVRANGHGGHLEGRPVDRTPKLAGRLGFGDLKAVDLVADGDGADMARLDVAPDRLNIGALRNPDLSNATTVFDTGGPRDDRTDHGIQRVDLVHLQKRRARVQTIQPHMGRVEAELLVIGLAEQGGPADPGPSRPDHLDGAGVGIG